MSRVNKPSRLVLAPTDELIEILLSDNRVTRLCLTDKVCVLESADATLIQSLQVGGRGWTRIFEEYYLASSSEGRAQGVLVGAFFDWLADRYNKEIDSSRNLACYEELYDTAKRLRGAAGVATVLDLGCGPGTILRSCIARSVEVLVGYDLSAVAARAAASAGLTVMPRDVFLVGPARFDVALSAYTMHYACDLAETLAAVQCNLKSGGVWALNFHKDIGLDAFLASLEPTQLRLTAHARGSAFGSIVAVTKYGA